jgi:hypothetical protein
MNTLRGVLALAFVTVISVSPVMAQTQYAWTGLENVQTNRLDRDGIGANYLAAPKALPALTNPATAVFLFTTFSFVNPFDAPAGFFIEDLHAVTEVVGGVHLVAYLGAYDPFSLGTNYLGDSGYSCNGLVCGELVDFSVLAPANATVEIAAIRILGPLEGTEYTAAGGDFEFDAFFASPAVAVPEPGVLALVGSGLVLISLRGRKRTRTA